jgi:nicotinic acid mononucleotide adenylyltransferase
MSWSCSVCTFDNSDDKVKCGLCDTMREGYDIFQQTKGNSVFKTKEKAYITFGRFQPPTKGHKVLFDEVSRLARENDGDAYIFVINCDGGSCIQNPLPLHVRINVLKKMYPSESTNLNIIALDQGPLVSLEDVMSELIEARHYLPENITIVEGSDRVQGFKDLVESLYFTKNRKIETAEAALKELKIIIKLYQGKINVLQAGKNRKEGANANNSPASISGTKVRQAALDGNKELFNQGVMIGNMTPNDSLLLMNQIRKLEGLTPLQGGGRKTRKNRKYN